MRKTRGDKISLLRSLFSKEEVSHICSQYIPFLHLQPKLLRTYINNTTSALVNMRQTLWLEANLMEDMTKNNATLN